MLSHTAGACIIETAFLKNNLDIHIISFHYDTHLHLVTFHLERLRTFLDVYLKKVLFQDVHGNFIANKRGEGEYLNPQH